MSVRALATARNKSLAPAALRRGAILQRKCECGNHTVGGECKECRERAGLQRQLKVGTTNDPLEAEADRVADQVIAGSAEMPIGRTPGRVQRDAVNLNGDSGFAPPSVESTLANAGSPLPQELRTNMEQRLGYDFSMVRVHADETAAQSAGDVNANAYTLGHHIVFGAGQFSPASQEGKRLLAHELTHVIQQDSATALRKDQDNCSEPPFDVPILEKSHHRSILNLLRMSGHL
jgi:hypothetical protein